MSRIAPSTLRFAQAAAALLMATPAFAQPHSSDHAATRSAMGDALSSAEHKATEILSQPVRDVGLFGREVPEPLRQASRDPYGLAPSSSCADIDSEIAQLDGTLGPEPNQAAKPVESRLGKVAEAGGRAAVNSLVPFRTVLREVSGAALNERRLQAAIDVGYERRGFLRGVYQARSCERMATVESKPRSNGEDD